jgi:hypothetical protein
MTSGQTKSNPNKQMITTTKKTFIPNTESVKAKNKSNGFTTHFLDD